MGLGGWGLGLPILTSIQPHYIPIALSTCFSFIVQGSALVLSLRDPSPARRRLLATMAGVTVLFGVLTFAGYFANADLTLEGKIFASGEYLDRFPINRMSPFTGLLFSLTGAALVLLLQLENKKPTPHLVLVLGSAVGLTGLTGTIAYAYGDPLLYGGTVIPMALSTSAAFMFLGGGLAAAAGPGAFLLKPLKGDSVRAMLLRTFVPLGFLALIVSDILKHFVSRSASAFVSATSAICFAIVTAAVVAHAARKLGNTVDRAQAERRRAEEALRESEARYRQLADSITDVFFALDTELRCTYWNKASHELTGVSAEAALGKTLYELFPKFEGTKTETFYLDALRTSQPKSLTFEYRTGDRNVFLELSAYPSRTGLSVFARDITQRKRGESALRESKNLLAKAQEIAHIGHWKLNPDTYAIEGSEELFRLLGLDPQDFAFETFVDMVLPDQREFVVNTVRQSIAERRGFDIEIWMTRPDREIKSIRSIGEPVVDQEGKLTMMVGTAQDITDRKRAEEERAKMATIIEQAAEGIFITDKMGNIEYVNPAIERISGYGREELIGRNFRMFRTDHHDDAFYRSMWNCVTHGETWSGHVVNRMKDERIREFDTTLSPIRDSSGRVIGFVSVNRDVTHEVKLEKQLQQAQKMEAVGTLAGGIAHDFNNILGIIIGYTEITLLDIPEDSPARQSLKEVHKAAERARDLVRQILAFSRKGEQQRIALRVSSIVKEALKFLRPALPVTIEIHQQLDELPLEGDTVIADPTQVHQVLMNLCTNAAQAMGDKGGVLHVGLALVRFGAQDLTRPAELGPGPYIRLKVSDTGHGMDRAVVDRIFEPYFTTKRPGEGTGLGLAVVHGIVKSHGGAITVYSSPGEGTTFHVYLPAATGGVAAEESRSQPFPRGNETILFVDDEVALASAGKQMLEFLGYTVESRTSSIEALQAFRATPDKFDLIITDMTMPQMTGLDLAQEVLRIRPEIPIIVCTGFSSVATPEKIKAAGIRRLLMKPLIMHDMAGLVREVLDEPRQTES
jgi:PAS domain S-box-containing protein